MGKEGTGDVQETRQQSIFTLYAIAGDPCFMDQSS